MGRRGLLPQQLHRRYVRPRRPVVTAVSLRGQGIAAASVRFEDICGALPALATLSLPENSLAGGISGVTACTGFQDLTLAFNGFSGAVPNLSPLTKLRTLNISSNCFAGAFPWASLVSMPELAKPHRVSAANIGGVIPPGIGDLLNLDDLELADNYLTGEIPPEITKLTELQVLDLYNNSLRGHLPVGFGKLTKLQWFDASMNNLNGSLSELRSLTQLVSLQLFDNT
ncbi:hypothetical protein BAE44_0003203, partial [Dichanthelium oligosanthes]